MSDPTKQPIDGEQRNGFFVNNGTFSGNFTTPDGDAYDIRKLEPREVTDPRTCEVTTIWGGYATARDREVAAKDAIMQAQFKKSGERPAELFAPEARDIPLYITLRNRPGKGFTDIGSFWNARGRFTILARDLGGKSGLRFGGNVLAFKTLPSSRPSVLLLCKQRRQCHLKTLRRKRMQPLPVMVPTSALARAATRRRALMRNPCGCCVGN